MSLKKRLLSLGAAAVLILSLAGCGDSGDIAELAEGYEDLSEEELDELMEAYENGEKASDSNEEKAGSEDGGLLSGFIDKVQTDTGEEKSSIPVLMIKNETDYIYSDDYEKVLYIGNCQAPLMTDEYKDSFPALAESLSAEADQLFESYGKDKEDYIDAAKEHYAEDSSFFEYGNYENNNNVLIRRLDEKVFSYAAGVSTFMGGAHGIYSEIGYNYDVQTGERLSLRDIMPDVSGLNTVLKEKLLEKYDPEEFFDLEGALENYDADVTEYQEGEEKYPYNFTLTPLGIVFYFGPYELASYAAGSQTVMIGYDEYPRVFTAEYIPESTGSFIYDFSYTTDLFDINGDGKADTLSVDYDYGEEGDYYDGVTVSVNGNSDSISGDLFIGRSNYKRHYIRLADGRQYVYAEGFVYDDHREFLVFDISDGEVKAVDRSYLDYAQAFLNGEGEPCYIILSDPESMEMDQLFSILSTFYGRRTYHVGADGMPESDERYRVINSDMRNTLTSKKELTCDIVDEDGNILSTKETIPSGETFFLLATDGETYIDARISDGRIVRLNITDTEFPCYVDGVSAEDCFEVLYYVG